MPSENRSSKITTYRRHSWLNVGTIIFGAILLYMIALIFMYLTAKHVTSYEVTLGSISGNYRYTALALKNEQLVSAGYSGYVTYYARNNARAASGSMICSISETLPDGSMVSSVSTDLTDKDLDTLRSSMASYTLNYSNISFQDVYDFKADLESTILQSQISDTSMTDVSANGVYTDMSGFIVYAKDSLEGLTEDNITPQLFNRNNYERTNLRTDGQVRIGDDLYKIITGEDWYLYFPVTDTLATQLAERTTVRFRFLKDNTTFSSSFSLIENNGNCYGKITLHNSLVRYVADRYLEIELLMDSVEGLKVPSSAIAEQTFYSIPEEYVIENEDDSTEITLLRGTFRNDGSEEVAYITASVYDKGEDYYLVATNLFEEGDYVQITGTAKKYTLTEDDLVSIQGVYNINKGYAIFRQVQIIDENEQFCIVEPYNVYGLAAHDFIVLDASTVSEDEIVY